jgi:serine/threonine-protein kinase
MLSNARGVRCCTTCGAVYRAQYPRCLSDGTELVTQARDPLVGNTVGPYVVDALLGEGGMGRVYRVHHARLLQKRYAMKVLLGDYSATPPMRMRFAKEAQSASRLSHPNVVAVCDFGVTEAGLAYLAMDLVEGTPLSHLISDKPMAPDRVVHLARQLCAGLAHAHDLGLIHRDFKPDNIIVVNEPAGEVPRIADFGLAISADDSDIRLTTAGMVLGTPAYVAPEQCVEGDVDHRADLYALGVTMFELLTGGKLPFDGEAAEVVGLKATTSPPTLAEVAPAAKVPPALAALVHRLIARKAADRYPDARAVAAALDEAVRSPDDVSAVAEVAAAGNDQPVRADARRARAARADDVALAAAPRDDASPAASAPPSSSTPSAPSAPFTRRESTGRRKLTNVRPAMTPAPRRSRTGLAIAAISLAIAGIVVAAVAWSNRAPAATPAVAPVAAADLAGGSRIPAEDAIQDAKLVAAPAAPASPAATAPAAAPPPAPPAADQTDPPDRPEPGAAKRDRTRSSKRTVGGPRPKRTAKLEPAAPAPEPAPEPAPSPEARSGAPASATASPPAAPAVPPPALPAVPPPPAAPVSIAPRFASLDVHGALPHATVQRALDRVLAATRGCTSDRAGAVEVRFTIGEARRPAGVRASGPAGAGGCLTRALSGLRTDSAPDVGDVEVRVRFAYDQTP